MSGGTHVPPAGTGRTTTPAKAIAAAIGTVLLVVTSAIADDVINMPEWAEIVSSVVIGIGTVYAVWRTRNRPRASA